MPVPFMVPLPFVMAFMFTIIMAVVVMPAPVVVMAVATTPLRRRRKSCRTWRIRVRCAYYNAIGKHSC